MTVDGGAGNAVMPGTLAREYARLGGAVRLMGKVSVLCVLCVFWVCAVFGFVCVCTVGGRAEHTDAHHTNTPTAKKTQTQPDAVIYDAAREMVPAIPAARWLAVGDSLEHDIAGCVCECVFLRTPPSSPHAAHRLSVCALSHPLPTRKHQSTKQLMHPPSTLLLFRSRGCIINGKS